VSSPFVSWTRVARECRAPVSATARLVLYALASRAEGGASGVAWPSVEQLRLDTGLSRRSVYTGRAELETHRVIERVSDAGRTTAWRILMPAEATYSEDGGVRQPHEVCATRTNGAPAAPVEGAPAAPGVRRPHSLCASRTEGGAAGAPFVRHTHSGVQQAHPEVSHEGKTKSAPPSGAAPGAPAVGALPSTMPWQPSDEWLDRVSAHEGGMPLQRIMATAILERKALRGLLAEAGFADDVVPALWPRLAEHWQQLGERPTAWFHRTRPAPGMAIDMAELVADDLPSLAGHIARIAPVGREAQSA
jgi:hypothetical protein